MRGYTTSLLGKQSRNDSLRELQQFDGQVTWFLLSAVNLKVFWIRELPCLSLPNPRSSQCFRAKAVSKLRPRCERAGPHRAGRTLRPCSPGHAGPVSQGSPISVAHNESRCFFFNQLYSNSSYYQISNLLGLALAATMRSNGSMIW